LAHISIFKQRTSATVVKQLPMSRRFCKGSARLLFFAAINIVLVALWGSAKQPRYFCFAGVGHNEHRNYLGHLQLQIPHCSRASKVRLRSTAVPGPSNNRNNGLDLLRDGLEFIKLPIPNAQDSALAAGHEIAEIGQNWRAIKNGDDNRGRRQTYVKMRRHLAPLSQNSAVIIEAAQNAVHERLGRGYIMNDCVVIADFDDTLTRQELHRDIQREVFNSTTHGLLVPLAPGACLHVIPGSHAPRNALRGSFHHDEVVRLDVKPGWALLWDGMLVHAGDGAMKETVPGLPNRPRLHGYVELESEPRPFDHKGDRSITENY